MVSRKEADIRLIRENTYIRFDNKVDCNGRWETKDLPHFKIWINAQQLLKDKGYKFHKNKEFEKQYQTLLKYHKWGMKNRLRFEMEIYPAGFEIQFFQNVKHENKCGGKYDFDKYKGMPKNHKIMFNSISKYIINNLSRKFKLKYYNQSTISFPRLTAEELIIKHIQECSFDRNKQTSLKQTERYMSNYDFNYNSKSGVNDTIKCGEIRKFKDYSDKIRKGKVYHNINNMWWIVTSKYKFYNIASFNILEKISHKHKK